MDELQNLFDSVRAGAIDDCLECGACIEACPYFGMGQLTPVDPAALSAGRLNFLKTGACSEQAYQFIRGCLLCGSCEAACPLDLNPHCINLLCRNLLSTANAPFARRFAGDTAHLQDLLPSAPFNRFKLIHSLQVKPDEVAWFSDIPNGHVSADTVLFLSCMVFSRADRVFTLMDLVRATNTRFIALSGVDFCCGFLDFITGRHHDSQQNIERIAKALAAVGAKTLIVDCATCYGWFRTLSTLAPLPFKVEHIYQHMHKNLNTLTFREIEPKRVAIHKACHFGRLPGEEQVLHTLAQAIPGLSLCRLDQADPDKGCCGASAAGFSPDLAKKLREQRLSEAQSAGIDTLLTSCDGCHGFLSSGMAKMDMPLRPLESVIADALGIHHADRLRPLQTCRSAHEILTSTAGNLWQEIYPAKDIGPAVAKIFNVPLI